MSPLVTTGRRTLHLAAWGWALLIAVLLSLPPSLMQPAGTGWQPPAWLAAWGDEMTHFVLFAVLAALALGGGAEPRRALTASAAYGALTEILHLLLPYRAAQWGDLAADLAGVAVVGAVAALRRRRRP